LPFVACIGEFELALEKKAGVPSREAFEAFKAKMLEHRGLSEASSYIPPFALRGGARAAFTLSKYALKLLSIGTKGTFLTGPFSSVMDHFEVRPALLSFCRWGRSYKVCVNCALR
jgi:hypothetical protein